MLKRLISSFVIFCFILSNYQPVFAQDFSVNELPVPGTMVGESAPFSPLALKGLVINPQKPLEFQFIVDTGNSLPLGGEGAGGGNKEELRKKLNQLVKYFLAGLTIPEGDLWVNLSPYEKNRMIPEVLGQTDLGRDLLAQDYILKQLSASLIYPEKGLGKEFWSRVYAKAEKQFGTTNIPVNTFNKVWILPDQSQVFEHGPAAYITNATLKVMLDQDYLAMQKHQGLSGDSSVNQNCRPAGCQAIEGLNVKARQGNNRSTNTLASQIIRQIILPEIQHEVNTGKNFAVLRQIYGSLILAKWYKETIQNGLLEAVYTNKSKVDGVNLSDPAIKEKIYERYLQAYKKGAFNYIKEDAAPDGQVVPRKYFSGGFMDMGMVINRKGTPGMIHADGAMAALEVSLTPDAGMFTRRQFLRTVLAGGALAGGAIVAGKLSAQQSGEAEGSVYRDYWAALTTKIKYTGKTDTTLYALGSSHLLRTVLTTLGKYQYLFAKEVSTDPVNYQNIRTLQESLQQEFMKHMGDELKKFSGGQDIAKMSFTSFVLVVLARYLAQYNILIRGEVLGEGQKEVIYLYFYEINKIENIDLNPTDIWGASLNVDRIDAGEGISVDGHSLNPMGLSDVANAQNLNGNIIFYNDLFLAQVKAVITMEKKDQFLASLENSSDEKFILFARDSNNEVYTLEHSVNMMRANLLKESSENVLSEAREQTTVHESKHVVDKGKGSTISLEVDGHLAGMRKNAYGWFYGVANAWQALQPENSNRTDMMPTNIAMQYILKKIVDYILAHRSNFPMIKGDVFDVYTVKAQLYKLMGEENEALRKRLIDAVYYQHQKEYGHEADVLLAGPQTVWDDQKVFGIPKKVLALGVAGIAATVAGVVLLHKHFKRLQAIKQQPVTPKNLPRAERRALEKERKKNAKKNAVNPKTGPKPSDSAMKAKAKAKKPQGFTRREFVKAGIAAFFLSLIQTDTKEYDDTIESTAPERPITSDDPVVRGVVGIIQSAFNDFNDAIEDNTLPDTVEGQAERFFIPMRDQIISLYGNEIPDLKPLLGQRKKIGLPALIEILSPWLQTKHILFGLSPGRFFVKERLRDMLGGILAEIVSLPPSFNPTIRDYTFDGQMLALQNPHFLGMKSKKSLAVEGINLTMNKIHLIAFIKESSEYLLGTKWKLAQKYSSMTENELQSAILANPEPSDWVAMTRVLLLRRVYGDDLKKSKKDFIASRLNEHLESTINHEQGHKRKSLISVLISPSPDDVAVIEEIQAQLAVMEKFPDLGLEEAMTWLYVKGVYQVAGKDILKSIVWVLAENKNSFNIVEPEGMTLSQKNRFYFVKYAKLDVNQKAKVLELMNEKFITVLKKNDGLTKRISARASPPIKVAASTAGDHGLINGGIDLNQINVRRAGQRIKVQFDQAQLNELEQADFKGFSPEITDFRYIKSPFQLLGIK